MTSNVATIPLNDGTTIPQLGLGVFQMTEDEAEAAVLCAHEQGYVLIDCAAGYENERAVGKAVAQHDRKDFYLTTKLKNDDQGFDETLRAFDASMDKLGVDTLDLYLIHWPSPARDKYVDSWRALVRLRDEGRVTSIGVSNFEPHHLKRIIAATGVVPAINQIELHPLLQQTTRREIHTELGIVNPSVVAARVRQGRPTGAPAASCYRPRPQSHTGAGDPSLAPGDWKHCHPKVGNASAHRRKPRVHQANPE